MHEESDPIERLFRIEAMKGELEELSHGQMIMGEMSEGLPPDITEQFLAQTLAYERADMVTHKELLARDGVAMPPAEEFTDEELSFKLIEIIHSLADHRVYLENTDHLSDRALYLRLRDEVLDEYEPELPPDMLMNCHIDLVGSGSEADIALWMTYYADDETRARWIADFPDYILPARQDPPYDRDRQLPQPPPPLNPYDDPDVVAAFLARCRARLVQQLTTDAIDYGTIVDEPLSYSPDLACVWAIEGLGTPGTIEWWAISGDLPTIYLPAAEYPTPRAFLLAVSARFRTLANARKATAAREEDTGTDWPTIQANILEHWAECDEAWDEDAPG